jgi:hypothetical protein
MSKTFRQKLSQPYKNRDEKLRNMGFDSYRDYLQSELWRLIRAAVIERDNGICCLCNGEAKTAHHTCYTKAALSGRSIEGLIAICHSCHKFIERSQEGYKTRLNDSRQWAKYLARRNGVRLIWPAKRKSARADLITVTLREQADRLFCHSGRYANPTESQGQQVQQQGG